MRSFNFAIITFVFSAIALIMDHAAAQISPKQCQFAGVNLAGAEFGTDFPGTYGVTYTYPEPQGSAAFFRNKGMNIFRLPFKWQRLQRNIDSASFDSMELSRLKKAVEHITDDLDAFCILDPHNYGRYGPDIIGESAAVPESKFALFWKNLANEFKSNSKVIFGLMNEPYHQDTLIWIQSANAAIASIRSVNAPQLILVPGNRWTGGHSWYVSDSWGLSNADALLRIRDPAENYAIEIHQYLDSDYSGTSANCVSSKIGSQTLIGVTDWLKKHGKKGFLGEFGAGSSQTCLLAVEDMLTYLDSNSEIWLGWTWWAAGPWWGNYFMSIEPNSGSSVSPQMAVLEKHFPPMNASERVPIPNQLSITSFPKVITELPFNITAEVSGISLSTPKVLLVDILSLDDYAFLGQGKINILSSSSTYSIKVFPDESAIQTRIGEEVMLKIWIVESSTLMDDPETAWKFSLAVKDGYRVKVQSSQNNPPLSSPSPSSTFVRLTSFPDAIESAAPFSVTVDFSGVSLSPSKTIVVDILKPETYDFYGSGRLDLNDTISPKDLQVTPFPSVSEVNEKFEVLLKVWIVETSIYDSNPSEAWKSELISDLSTKIFISPPSTIVSTTTNIDFTTKVPESPLLPKIDLINPPTVISSSSEFTVSVSFQGIDLRSPKMILVDLLTEDDYTWLGNGKLELKSAESPVDLVITPIRSIMSSSSSRVILKAWIVDSLVYSQDPAEAWKSALVENSNNVAVLKSSIGTTPAPSLPGKNQPRKLPYTGVNLASAEFGSQIPGTYGTTYIYPEPSGSASFFASKGMNVFRLPFKWERLQRSLSVEAFDTSEMQRLRAAVSHITNFVGAYCVLDPHNYGRYGGEIIGENVNVPISKFAIFWKLLAAEFKDNERVIFGLMNEPYNQDTDMWAKSANAAISAIRSIGAQQLILVPGTRWTGGHSWARADKWGSSNADAMMKIVDPSDNIAFEIHQYLDSDFSGTNEQCVSASIGSETLMSVTNWLRSNGHKAFLGEFGGGSSTLCLTAIDNMLSFLELSSDVWIGWTWWAAGPWWGNYFMSVEPQNGASNAPQLNVLLNHIYSSPEASTIMPTAAPPVSTVVDTEYVKISSFPPEISESPFLIKASFHLSSTPASAFIIVDILTTEDYKWLGSGKTTVEASSSSVELIVTPIAEVGLMDIDTEVILKIWIVEKSIYEADPEQAWKSALVSDVSAKTLIKANVMTTTKDPNEPSTPPTSVRKVDYVILREELPSVINAYEEFPIKISYGLFSGVSQGVVVVQIMDDESNWYGYGVELVRASPGFSEGTVDIVAQSVRQIEHGKKLRIDVELIDEQIYKLGPCSFSENAKASLITYTTHSAC